MLTLATRNEDELLKETRAAIENASIPSGISSIEIPPFKDVKIIIFKIESLSEFLKKSSFFC